MAESDDLEEKAKKYEEAAEKAKEKEKAEHEAEEGGLLGI